MTPPDRWLGIAAGALLGKRYPFVLCYHGIGDVAPGADPHGLFVSRDLFARHLDLIEEQGYELLALGELWKRMQAGAAAERKGAISFDDGLVRAAREGVPMLLERGMRCSMFIATGLLGKRHPDLEQEMVMSASEVVELADAGVEVGSHTVDHPWLDRLPYDDALDQLRRSRAVLEDLLGKPVTSLAYPYGEASAQTRRAAAQAGYELACTCTGPGPWRALRIPRQPVYPTATTLRLRLKMAGLYGPIHALKGGRR